MAGLRGCPGGGRRWPGGTRHPNAELRRFFRLEAVGVIYEEGVSALVLYAASTCMRASFSIPLAWASPPAVGGHRRTGQAFERPWYAVQGLHDLVRREAVMPNERRVEGHIYMKPFKW